MANMYILWDPTPFQKTYYNIKLYTNVKTGSRVVGGCKFMNLQGCVSEIKTLNCRNKCVKMCICRNRVDASTTSLEVILICIHDVGMIIDIFGRDRKEINYLKYFKWGTGYIYFRLHDRKC